MRLKHIVLENFRNHERTEIAFEPNLNIFFGPNGSGKTSILEAISITSFSKSFITNFDQQIVKHSKDYYAIEVEAESETKVPFKVYVQYQINKGKEIRDTSGQLLSSTELIGRIPIVILYPDMREIIFGPPSARREFVDKILSQTDQSYLKKLIEYRRIVKQRNKLLSEIASGDRSQIDVLFAWNSKFLHTAVDIVRARGLFAQTFSSLIQEPFEQITSGKEEISFAYEPFEFSEIIDPASDANFSRNWDPKEIEFALNELRKKYSRKEVERGTTLFGPHKDDFGIFLNSVLARLVASQGQSKSILIALKNAEVAYLQNKLGTTPVVLFDDVFSELDFERVSKVLHILNNLKVQLFLTLTEIDKIKNIIPNFETYGIYKVENGVVEKT